MFREVARINKRLTKDECVQLLKNEKRGVLSLRGDGYILRQLAFHRLGNFARTDELGLCFILHHSLLKKTTGGSQMVICRCGCEFENDRWDSHVRCPACGRIYPNSSPDMYHPKSEEELRWKCISCGEINENSYAGAPRTVCVKCGAKRAWTSDRCCICGKAVKAFHNPEPIRDGALDCCDRCNRLVIKAREKFRVLPRDAYDAYTLKLRSMTYTELINTFGE